MKKLLIALLPFSIMLLLLIFILDRCEKKADNIYFIVTKFQDLAELTLEPTYGFAKRIWGNKGNFIKGYMYETWVYQEKFTAPTAGKYQIYSACPEDKV